MDALARQPVKELHASIASARQLGQVEDQGAPGSTAGIAQEGHCVVPEAPNDPDSREIGRLGHDQAKEHLGSSLRPHPGQEAFQQALSMETLAEPCNTR